MSSTISSNASGTVSIPVALQTTEASNRVVPRECPDALAYIPKRDQWNTCAVPYQVLRDAWCKKVARSHLLRNGIRHFAFAAIVVTALVFEFQLQAGINESKIQSYREMGIGLSFRSPRRVVNLKTSSGLTSTPSVGPLLFASDVHDFDSYVIFYASTILNGQCAKEDGGGCFGDTVTIQRSSTTYLGCREHNVFHDVNAGDVRTSCSSCTHGIEQTCSGFPKRNVYFKSSEASVNSQCTDWWTTGRSTQRCVYSSGDWWLLSLPIESHANRTAATVEALEDFVSTNVSYVGDHQSLGVNRELRVMRTQQPVVHWGAGTITSDVIILEASLSGRIQVYLQPSATGLFLRSYAIPSYPLYAAFKIVLVIMMFGRVLLGGHKLWNAGPFRYGSVTTSWRTVLVEIILIALCAFYVVRNPHIGTSSQRSHIEQIAEGHTCAVLSSEDTTTGLLQITGALAAFALFQVVHYIFQLLCLNDHHRMAMGAKSTWMMLLKMAGHTKAAALFTLLFFATAVASYLVNGPENVRSAHIGSAAGQPLVKLFGFGGNLDKEYGSIKQHFESFTQNFLPVFIQYPEPGLILLIKDYSMLTR